MRGDMSELDFTLCNMNTLYNVNKTKEYREGIILNISILMKFLKDNDLIFIEPFDEDGSLRLDFVLKKSNAAPECTELFKKVIPGWLNYLDRGGDPKNVSRLDKGLKKIRES
jgi:trans-2-enoyl-CoA reductase